MGAAVTGQDRDFEASVEELVENGWAKVASSLHENLGVSYLVGHRREMIIPSSLTPANATLVMLLILAEDVVIILRLS